jgi:hypothetical protein
VSFLTHAVWGDSPVVAVAATVFFEGLTKRLQEYWGQFHFTGDHAVPWLRGFLCLRRLNDRFGALVQPYGAPPPLPSAYAQPMLTHGETSLPQPHPSLNPTPHAPTHMHIRSIPATPL